MAVKGARGRTTLVELVKVFPARTEHFDLNDGTSSYDESSVATRFYAFMSDGSVLERTAYKVTTLNKVGQVWRSSYQESGTWHVRVKPYKATPAEIEASHTKRIETLLGKGYTRAH